MGNPTKHIIIQVTNQGIYHSKENLVSWENTNFPAKEHFGLNERGGIFWKVALIRYNKSNEELEIKVTDYDAKEEGSLLEKHPKYPISRLKFQKLNGFELKNHLSYFKWIEFAGLIDETQEPIPKQQAQPHTPLTSLTSTSKIDSKDYFEVQSTVKPYYLNFEVPLKKTNFKDGYVEVIKKISQSVRAITIKLTNEHIHSEFDNIKPFFAKALGTKKIRVKGKVHLLDGEVIESNCI